MRNYTKRERDEESLVLFQMRNVILMDDATTKTTKTTKKRKRRKVLAVSVVYTTAVRGILNTI